MLRDGEDLRASALNPGHEVLLLQYRPGNFQIIGLVGVEIILLLIHGLGLFDGFVGYPAVKIGDVQKIIKFSIYLKSAVAFLDLATNFSFSGSLLVAGCWSKIPTLAGRLTLA